MPAAENKATVAAGYAGFGRGDLEPLLAALADNIVWTSYGDPAAPTAGEFRGRDGVNRYFEGVGAIDITKFDVHTLIAEEDMVVALGNIDFTVKATGNTSSGPLVHVFGFSNGLITTFDEFEHHQPGVW
ncbi:MAG TPA: nuclear transport factor 2 family protein [Mycobacteriales bacterium]|nr:nuclear transport factor 2 family protein [Mycobacteriales bacterium]